MTNRIAKDEMALLMPNSLGHYFKDDLSDMPAAEAGTSWFARAVRWLVELPQRQAVMAELSALSDHELADIGLTRGELTNVFDAQYADVRNSERGINRIQTGRAFI